MPKLLARATVAVVWLLAAAVAQAQSNLQLWGNITFNWVKSQRLVYELDIEPKVLLDAPEGEPGWWSLDLTPNVEFSPKPWLDLLAHGVVGVTKQTDDVDSFEVTPRLGVRFHLFSRTQAFHPLERAPRRRWVYVTSSAWNRGISSTAGPGLLSARIISDADRGARARTRMTSASQPAAGEPGSP